LTSFQPLHRKSICEYLVAEKTCRTGRAGDPCVCARILCFPKPSVHGFPTAIDPADRSCRYLVQPLTVPSLARQRGYPRPPRGGRGKCRRACERTPSGAAPAAPPAAAAKQESVLEIHVHGRLPPIQGEAVVARQQSWRRACQPNLTPVRLSSCRRVETKAWPKTFRTGSLVVPAAAGSLHTYGPRPSPRPIANSKSSLFHKTCIVWIFIARLPNTLPAHMQ
jgi:hypothetical protein